MHVEWSFEIQINNFVHYDFMCKPIVWNNQVYYAFKYFDEEKKNGIHLTSLVVIQIDLQQGSNKHKRIKLENYKDSESEICSTRNWKFQIINEQIFLFIGFWLDLNSPELKPVEINEKVEEFKVKSDYYFGGYHLRYNKRSTFDCFDKNTGAFKWKLKTKGYLYSEIYLKNNCLVFGTAGNGGAFYCVDLESGLVLSEFVNGDASQFEWMHDLVVLKDKKGNLVKISPEKNSVVDQLDLKEKLFYAPFLVHNNVIITTVYNKKTGFGKIICVE